jgi:sugar transferase (PEP-CTERM/EpsH1 system associated)
MMITGARPQILALAHRIPYPPDKGDRIRTYHLLRWLSARAEVHLACLTDEPIDPSAVAALERFCVQVAVVRLGWGRWARALGSLARGGTISAGAFDAPALRATLRRWAGGTEYRAAYASASSLVPYLRRGVLRGIPAVIDLVDVDSQKWLDYAGAGGPRSWLYRFEGLRLRRLERGLPGWARAVTLVSPAEARLYRRFCIDGPVYAIGNGVDLDAFRPDPSAKESGCVFVGALDYRPNVEGIVGFCREAWPALRRRRPDATLRLVGRRPVAAVRHLGEVPGVEVIGQVPDVRPYLAGAAVAIVPLRMARGLQNKVLEALAMGKATVASPASLAGLRAEPGVHLMSASDPAEWVEHLDALLCDAGLRRRLGAAGRDYAERNHHWDRCLAPFGPLLGLADGPAGESSRGHDAPALADFERSPR